MAALAYQNQVGQHVMNTLIIPSVGGFADIDSFAKVKIDCVDWPDEYPYAPDVQLSAAHTEDRILLRFEVTEDHVRAVTLESNGPVWEDSCCEFFVQVPGSPYYFNFETNCVGTGLAAKRVSRSDCEHFGPELMASVIRRASLPAAPVDVRGGMSWSLELEVPFSLLGCDSCPAELMANFYKCGDRTDRPHFLSWNRVETETPDFHRPEYFGRLILK